MTDAKRPVWPLNVAIEKGKIAIGLLRDDREYMEGRLQPGYIMYCIRSVEELEGKPSGQAKQFINQTSQTADQNTKIKIQHEKIQMIKNLVKAETDDPAILNKYGVGMDVSKNTVSGVIKETEVVVQAYEDDPDWANNMASILEEDILDLMESADLLSSVDGSQEKSKFSRKVSTKSKNSSQLQVEKMVRKVSNIGILVFSKQNPERVSLYRDLIP